MGESGFLVQIPMWFYEKRGILGFLYRLLCGFMKSEGFYVSCTDSYLVGGKVGESRFLVQTPIWLDEKWGNLGFLYRLLFGWMKSERF